MSTSSETQLDSESARISPSDLPAGPLVAWYGDDFTGAAAVMEVLSFAGLPSMLFLEPPTSDRLDRFPGLRGIGVASTARAESPDWMQAELPEIFARLWRMKPAILHYKVCSTLDSSPEIGSIGRALEIGAEATGGTIVPILIAAPQMRRYQVFGQLFAAHGDKVYRLDQHPVMSRHPVTPMSEADVAAHVAKQSPRLAARALTMEHLAEAAADPSPLERDEEAELTAIALDSWDRASETAAGRVIWENRNQSPFVVGSQGVEYALIRHWQASGALPPAQDPRGIGRASRMVSVSGSVSATTAGQIAWSRAHGFACIPFDASAACRGEAALRQEEDRVRAAALAALAEGRDPLIHTAEGPDDPAVARFRAALRTAGADIGQVNQAIGERLGRILRDILSETGVRRAVISGGDTSGHATRQLQVFALSVLAPTLPGASIFKVHADGPMDGLELALKGGQMGSPDYFGWVRDGGGRR
ncbi:four-carbon acid sugar kinase family protein [Phaeobacter sp. B1627]|uniref:four-carbon acid sugar kinase family protein n=1 Tax=Phaeobacter sp. B1627 TaxID=2583809 RepID=UPI0011199A6E|nr:four-carbon acid sugar kinase family protein [Phaeobacter sp. B1627]TNJ39946.1 four-carbon acid sugar kinase family protein [Phaeobacter sp. B1627]